MTCHGGFPWGSGSWCWRSKTWRSRQKLRWAHPFFVGQLFFLGTIFLKETNTCSLVPSMGRLSLVKTRLFGVYSTIGNMVGKAMAVHPQTLVAICWARIFLVHVGFVTYSLRLQQHGTMEPPTNEPLGWQWTHLLTWSCLSMSNKNHRVQLCFQKKSYVKLWNGCKSTILGPTHMM